MPQTAPQIRPATPDPQNPDRLSQIIFHANELNESRLWKIKISYQKRWTKHRRNQKSLQIQSVKPWCHSTGPKSIAGKARSSFNADKGGMAQKYLIDAMKAQRRFVRAVLLHTRLLNRGIPIPDSITQKLCAWGQDIFEDLTIGLAVFLWFHHVTGRNNE